MNSSFLHGKDAAQPFYHPALHGHALGAGLQGLGQMVWLHASQCVDGDGGSGQHPGKSGPTKAGAARVAARGKHRAAHGQIEFKAAGMAQVIGAVTGRSQQGVMLAQQPRVHAPCPAPGGRQLAPSALFGCCLPGQRGQIRPGQMQATSGAFPGQAGSLFGMAAADQQARVVAPEARQGFGQQVGEGVCRQVGFTQQQQTRQTPACPADHRGLAGINPCRSGHVASRCLCRNGKVAPHRVSGNGSGRIIPHTRCGNRWLGGSSGECRHGMVPLQP